MSVEPLLIDTGAFMSIIGGFRGTFDVVQANPVVLNSGVDASHVAFAVHPIELELRDYLQVDRHLVGADGLEPPTSSV